MSRLKSEGIFDRRPNYHGMIGACGDTIPHLTLRAFEHGCTPRRWLR